MLHYFNFISFFLSPSCGSWSEAKAASVTTASFRWWVATLSAFL